MAAVEGPVAEFQVFQILGKGKGNRTF